MRGSMLLLRCYTLRLPVVVRVRAVRLRVAAEAASRFPFGILVVCLILFL